MYICHLQLLERQVYSVARLGPDQSFLSLCHRRRVACCHTTFYKVNTKLIRTLITVCSASFNLLTQKYEIPEPAANPLEFEVSRYRTSKFARSFLSAQVRMWNFPYTIFDTGTLNGFKGAVNRWLLPRVVFSFSVPQMLVGLRKGIYKQVCIFHLGPVLQVLIIIIVVNVGIIIIAVVYMHQSTSFKEIHVCHRWL